LCSPATLLLLLRLLILGLRPVLPRRRDDRGRLGREQTRRGAGVELHAVAGAVQNRRALGVGLRREHAPPRRLRSYLLLDVFLRM
jgi:hypothetical protein